MVEIFTTIVFWETYDAIIYLSELYEVYFDLE
jgi:hypothetical protein